jgi:hypothetical protein
VGSAGGAEAGGRAGRAVAGGCAGRLRGGPGFGSAVHDTCNACYLELHGLHLSHDQIE